MTTSKPLYQVLASLLQRHRTLSNVIGTGDYLPVHLRRKTNIEDQLSDLLSTHLPRGSGFNAGCSLLMDECDSSPYRFPGRLVFLADFDHGDQGWTKHQVHCMPAWDDFGLVVTGPDRNGVKEYIKDVFGEVLGAQVPTQQMKSYRQDDATGSSVVDLTEDM